MEHYIASIIWFILWPLMIFVSYKFVVLNIKHFAKMERLEELERGEA